MQIKIKNLRFPLNYLLQGKGYDNHLMARVPERAHGYQSLGGSDSHQSSDIIEDFSEGKEAGEKQRSEGARKLEAHHCPGFGNPWIRSGLIFRLRVRLKFVFVFVVPITESADSMERTKAKKQQATVHRCEYRNLMERGQARTRRGKAEKYRQTQPYQLIDNGLMVVGNKARGSFIPTMIDERNEHTIPMRTFEEVKKEAENERAKSRKGYLKIEI
ncbi:hypothetical protein EDD85DRAFT_786389 [Armillaria nabsnona]|nr:hypothetical protein EDD85DRAFT_786389 [Armillaria nabsnona]